MKIAYLMIVAAVSLSSSTTAWSQEQAAPAPTIEDTIRERVTEIVASDLGRLRMDTIRASVTLNMMQESLKAAQGRIAELDSRVKELEAKLKSASKED